ncbi:MAG TPA: hypothetical protein VJ233_12930 [Hyphomicrobiaceae bacterium]|nr:hypothetical protein [Hyphomicrobiaceae bacterium]
MTLAATFLAGAKSRLLPASIPFRFFAAAAIFHILMWIALLVGAEQLTGPRGGPGPALAAVHLLTLGVLTTTAIGASVQLLPVATRRALVAVWPIKLVFWLTVPGMAAMVAGMFMAQMTVLMVAAALTTGGLLLFAALLADNLRRAGSLPVVAAYGWAALASLVLVAALGLALAFDYEVAALPDHRAAALAHMILGGFGFMGLLALGFSHVLVPMFALAAAPPRRPSLVGFALALAGLALGTLGALTNSILLLTFAALVGLGAAGLHLWLMQHVLRTGMRKRLGLSFLLIRAAWIMLPTTLLVALASLHGLAGTNGGTLFGLLLIGGWLLTFLLGVLQRILPFLASMHAPRSAGGAPPLMSELAASGPLSLHAVCHGVALLVLAASIIAGVPWLARTGAAIGLIGSIAFAWFTAAIVRRVAAVR